jgi:hypothetical protein
MHGPLFTMNPWSATQNFPGPNASCKPTTTTTGVTTTQVLGSTTIQTTSTLPTGSTTSTVPASTSVLGATTIASTSTTNYYAPTNVEPATQTRAVSPASAGLAATGFNSQIVGIVGLLLIVIGVLARRFSEIRNR